MKQALIYFESNEYDKAFQRMKEILKKNRSIESLHNVAWMYVNEEEDLDTGQHLLEEAIKLRPYHPFPFALLGEIYLRKSMLNDAEALLNKVLEMERLPAVVHNLGVVYARKKQWKKAAEYFQEIARPSSYELLLEIYSRIQFGDDMARELMLQWDEKHDDFIGWMEVADLWIELGEFALAKEGYEKEWDMTSPGPYSLNRYGYVLYQLGYEEQLMIIQEETLRHIEEELIDVKHEADWTEEDRQEQIQQLEKWYKQVQVLPDTLKSGFVPPAEIDFFVEGGCYLFGCRQHNHPFYKERK
ncbi:lipopolysaccharide assembly protein LapB [Paucisalibacillus sp. EB02]|uniref:tetratricopeptide repeat protein n=1 Tax=Paucisalibacillus sp. EB02 TaxID=1347087 RepID=UPI0005AB3F66|nr:hypothetical protein [Paucisalibacillus sp. EB02]